MTRICIGMTVKNFMLYYLSSLTKSTLLKLIYRNNIIYVYGLNK